MYQPLCFILNKKQWQSEIRHPMRINYIQIITFCFIFSVLASCQKENDLEPENDLPIDTEYPSKLFKLDPSVLNKLKLEAPYNINDYGLFKHEGNWGTGTSPHSDSNFVVNLAKNTLIKHSKFSNVTSDSSLTVNSSRTRRESGGNHSYWYVVFNNQVYKGLEIINTAINIRVMDSVEWLDGHHFKDIYIPEENLLPKDTITEKIIGYVIVYYSHYGRQEKEITKGLIVDDYIKKICWIEKEDFIEFRTVWEIPILATEGDGLIPVWWYLYVDVLSGEIVHIHQIPVF